MAIRAIPEFLPPKKSGEPTSGEFEREVRRQVLAQQLALEEAHLQSVEQKIGRALTNEEKVLQFAPDFGITLNKSGKGGKQLGDVRESGPFAGRQEVLKEFKTNQQIVDYVLGKLSSQDAAVLERGFFEGELSASGHSGANLKFFDATRIHSGGIRLPSDRIEAAEKAAAREFASFADFEVRQEASAPDRARVKQGLLGRRNTILSSQDAINAFRSGPPATRPRPSSALAALSRRDAQRRNLLAPNRDLRDNNLLGRPVRL